MKSKRANRSSKPSPSDTQPSVVTSAEPAAEAVQATFEAEDHEVAFDWMPLEFLETSGVYLCPEMDAKDIMVTRLFREGGPRPDQGWEMRLTGSGVFVHKKGAPMQWVGFNKCIRAIVWRS